ncbi:ABC transporter substrate-binding protein [Roseitranquillus sediminis]|uniref:ABC transporter substrate-binding protein n=1 Tax=Roseitranquillus sediminis TaxID=2809051 RepID=UPI001D0C9862|nr:ABC transporter substrate-binding protein [Roseitranquillus sediminis]MBM9593167.1 ABC transporter substrate-binding protein [Roseitranquillus sediminis]
MSRTISVSALALVAAFAGHAAPAQDLTEVSIVVFGPPSLGAFLPPVIKDQGLDEVHGLDITFAERTPDAYAAQFNSGEFEVGGSAALLTVGLAEARGVEATYLFNLFDFWGAVVTTRDDVQTLADLAGKDLAAATGTTNYQMFRWLAGRQGLDLSQVTAVNTATPGLVGYAMADRAAAVQLWEPAFTSLTSQNAEVRSLDLNIGGAWEEFAGSASIPYLGVAAHRDWVEANPDTVGALYAAYSDAAEWVKANPDEAAAVIAGGDATTDVVQNYADLIRNNDRLGLNVAWAGDLETEIRKVYEVGLEIEYLPQMPSDATIHAGGSAE